MASRINLKQKKQSLVVPLKEEVVEVSTKPEVIPLVAEVSPKLKEKESPKPPEAEPKAKDLT